MPFTGCTHSKEACQLSYTHVYDEHFHAFLVVLFACWLGSISTPVKFAKDHSRINPNSKNIYLIIDCSDFKSVFSMTSK